MLHREGVCSNDTVFQLLWRVHLFISVEVEFEFPAAEAISTAVAHEQKGNCMNYFDNEEGAALKTAFEEEVLRWPDVTATLMFGCPSYQADGTLFAVLVTGGVALTRLPDGHREQVAQTFETGPFQAGERTVTKWVQVTIDDLAALNTLVPHIEASYESAREESG